MKRKIIFLVFSAALLPAGCALGMLKTFKGMAEKGKPAYPAAKAILDKNPTIVATAKDRIEIKYFPKTGEEAGREKSDYTTIGETEELTKKTAKELSVQLGKLYPLKNIKFQPELDVLLDAGSLLKSMTIGGEMEKKIPETVTEELVLVYRISGSHKFFKNGKRNIHGEELGDIHYSGSFGGEFIDVKTKKTVVVFNLGEASQRWNDIPESSYDNMVKSHAIGEYVPRKAYADMIAGSKKALATFVAEVKAAKPSGETK